MYIINYCFSTKNCIRQNWPRVINIFEAALRPGLHGHRRSGAAPQRPNGPEYYTAASTAPALSQKGARAAARAEAALLPELHGLRRGGAAPLTLLSCPPPLTHRRTSARGEVAAGQQATTRGRHTALN